MTAPAPTNAQCAKHPERAAAATCDRCGTFACEACLSFPAAGGQRLCASCVALTGSGLPPLAPRAQLARVALLACGGLELVEAATSLIPGDIGAALQGLAGLGYLVSFICSAVVFCRWFHLAVRHATALGAHVGYTPAGAVGSWFIPFVNLVRPFQIARSMMQSGTDSRVGTWQALWIVGNVVGNISVRVDTPAVSIASGLLMAGAAFAATRVVEAITEANVARAEPGGFALAA
jgi:hypothetical protein